MDVREKASIKKRMIDAKEGKKVFLAIAQPAEYKGVIHMVVHVREIDKLPTVDAVEVVRCLECKYHNKPPCPMRLSFNWTEGDDFCSYGERKEGAD